MFSPDPNAFPNNIVLAVKTQLETMTAMEDVSIFLRPIRKGDPVQCIAVNAAMWTPDENSSEFTGMTGLKGPTINRYLISIQTFNQDMDEQRGLQTQAAMATAVRIKLSRDMDVRVALATLESEEFGFTERFTRSEFLSQRFLSNEIDGQFLFMSNTEFLVETETN